ncbi:Adenosine 5'-monophosphoramidase [Apophysomyces sp. BC1034]|nr:Adenosine 5'-monophosphoramidase [Apophysomyces sp. BC1034]
MSNYYHHDDYYYTHNNNNNNYAYQHDAYAMQQVPHSPPPTVPYHDQRHYDQYHMEQQQHYDPAYNSKVAVEGPMPATATGYQPDIRQRASILNPSNQYLHLNDEKQYEYPKERRSCCDWFCCGCCCGCCPRWIRWIACILLLLIVGLGIAIGVLAALFKTPDVKFNGLNGEPQFNLVGTTANISFSLSISVNNPNIESVTFSNIVAKAYYPGYRDHSIGGGQKDGVHISSNAITNIIFPFSISISPADTAILTDILSKCGLLGGEKQNIKVDYDVIPTIKILGIPISPTISNSANFPCPLELPDDHLADVLPIAKKIAAAAKLEQYNVLQNNGKLANQAVPHVHFHIIPKPDRDQGLGIRWKPIETSMEKIQETFDEIKSNM